MGNIKRHTGINLGGANSVVWLYKEDIASITFNESTLYASVTTKAGKAWNSLYGSPETIQLESESQDTPSGMKYIYKLKILVPKDRPGVEAELFRMSGRHLVVMLTDKNSITRLIGTMEVPMKLSGKLLKPPAMEGFNGYELLFSGEFSKPAGFVPGSSGGIPDEENQD